MSNKENERYRGSLLSDFYIEFLGSLVPGLFVLLLTFVVLGFSLFLLGRSLSPSNILSIISTTNYFGLGTYGVMGILLVSSYIFGSLFYRQDPKIPDWKSAQRVYKSFPETERERLAVQPTSKVPENNKLNQSDAQFPYFFLYEYLTGRGLDHLAKWVPWQGKVPSTWKYRSKMFINLLKIRLQYLIPEKCKEIVRNEAHVRMATSMWYATNWLIQICLIGMAVFVITLFSAKFVFDLIMFLNIAANLLVFLFTLFIRTQIENYIHYLRVREIVYVLETAHFASVNGHNLHPEDFLHNSDGTV